MADEQTSDASQLDGAAQTSSGDGVPEAPPAAPAEVEAAPVVADPAPEAEPVEIVVLEPAPFSAGRVAPASPQISNLLAVIDADVARQVGDDAAGQALRAVVWVACASLLNALAEAGHLRSLK